ncbi:MAG: serine/threonine protein kinase [Deltaproteobacteria bacterium]|nr:serine/threonine protein kinase [Deltaproteobacteria bacterium]
MLFPGKAMGALPKVGETIGPYRIKGLLGTSGMGGVFLVEGGAPSRELALALLDDRLHGDQAARERFFGWARALRRADHPNLVAIVEVVEQGAQQYVATEQLRGRTLAELIKDGPLPLPRALHIAWQVSQALAAAHDLGVVHGGLKLASVFVTIQSGARDAVKVFDFMSGEPGAGLAPEQQRGGEVDHRADIYAFGALLFQLATGRAPFVADTLLALKRAHLEQAPPAPSSLREVPATLDALVQSCMAKIPDARPDMMREVQASLREVALLLEHHRPEPALDPTGDFAVPAVGGWTVVPAPLVRHTRPAPIPGISGEGEPIAEPPAPRARPLILDPAAPDESDLPNVEPDEELPTVDPGEVASTADDTFASAAPAAPVAPAAPPAAPTAASPPPEPPAPAPATPSEPAAATAADALAEPSLGAADRSTDAAVLPRIALGIAEPTATGPPSKRGRRVALVAAGIAVAALGAVGLRFALAPSPTNPVDMPPSSDAEGAAPIADRAPPAVPAAGPTPPAVVDEPAAVVDAAPRIVEEPPPPAEPAPPVLVARPPKPAAAKPAVKPKEAARRPKPAAEAAPEPAKAAPPVEPPKEEGTLKEGALVNPFKKKPK